MEHFNDAELQNLYILPKREQALPRGACHWEI